MTVYGGNQRDRLGSIKICFEKSVYVLAKLCGIRNFSKERNGRVCEVSGFKKDLLRTPPTTRTVFLCRLRI